MSNRMKIKKHSTKVGDTNKNEDTSKTKYGAKFFNNKREKGTIVNNFSKNTSKDFSKKKT